MTRFSAKPLLFGKMDSRKPLPPTYMISIPHRNEGTPTLKGKSPSSPPRKPDRQPLTDLDITRSSWTAPQPLRNGDPLPSLETHASSVAAPKHAVIHCPSYKCWRCNWTAPGHYQHKCLEHPKNQPHVFKDCIDYDDYISADTDYNLSSEC